MKPLLLLGVAALLAGPRPEARTQAPLNDRDLADIGINRPFSALNLNRSTAASRAAAEAEAAHPEHYLSPDWAPGVVLALAGRPQPVPGLRYNMVRHWLEVHDPAVPGGLRVLPVGSIWGSDVIGANGQVEAQFGAYPGPGRDGRLFFQELTAPGPVRLLLRHEVELIAPVRNIALGVNLQPGYEHHYTQLYALAPGRAGAHPLPLTEKAVLKLFGPQADPMAAYAAQHQLRYSALPDLVQLVEEHNRTAPGPAAR